MTGATNATATGLFSRIVRLSESAKTIAGADTGDEYAVVQAVRALVEQIGLIAESGVNASTDDERRDEPAGTAITGALSDAKPLQGMSDSAMADLLAEAGMFPPSKSYRRGVGALQLRRDVSVSDALDTLSQRLTEVEGVLILLATCNMDKCVTNAASAANELLNEAMGMCALVSRAVYQGPESEGGAA